MYGLVFVVALIGYVFAPKTAEELEAYDNWMAHRDTQTPGVIFLALFVVFLVWMKWPEIKRFLGA